MPAHGLNPRLRMVTVDCGHGVRERLINASYALEKQFGRQFSLSAVVRVALIQLVTALEEKHNGGKPFPRRGAASLLIAPVPRPGRPRKKEAISSQRER